MGHTFSCVLMHVTFSTKLRRRWIDEALRERLFPYLGGLARKEFAACLCIGGTDDHIHALVEISMDVAPADAMRTLKSVSSGWVHKEFCDLAAFQWQAGYGAFSVSPSNARRVIRYIENQQEHHRRMNFEEEYRALLIRHKVPFDPEHFLD